MDQLHHGGRLRQAAEQFQIPLEEWLDLSTGVAPWTYPIPPIAIEDWNRLPEQNDGLELAAQQYYGGNDYQGVTPLAVAGSQAAIQQLPKLLNGQTVALPKVGYKEHQKAWQSAGWQVELYDRKPSSWHIEHCDVVLIINPNNPSSDLIDASQLKQWQQRLNQRGATLVVDEAFMDLWPTQSLVNHTGTEGLVVLRSIGKFFGLAGARVGFVFAWPALTNRLNVLLGPWCVAGPARSVAKTALLDSQWQQSQRQRIFDVEQQLANVIAPLPGTHHHRALFITVRHPDAPKWHHHLAQQGIYLRLTDEKDGLRFGLPRTHSELQRLEAALVGIVAA